MAVLIARTSTDDRLGAQKFGMDVGKLRGNGLRTSCRCTARTIDNSLGPGCAVELYATDVALHPLRRSQDLDNDAELGWIARWLHDNG